jgi:hypothetical protein
MRYLLWLICLPFLTIPVRAQSGSPPSTPVQSIPTTRGTLLSGQPISLPQDLTTRYTILILGFTEKSAASSKEWGKQTHDMLSLNPSIASFQLPVLASVPRLIRGIVLRSMKKDLSPDMQSAFLPIFDQENEWKQLVGFTAPDEAYILLIDIHGSVVWKTHGPPTPQQLQNLRDAVPKG